MARRFKTRSYTSSVAFNGSSSVLTKATPVGINTGTSNRSAMGWIYLNDDLVLSTFVQFKVNSAQSVSFTLGKLSGTYYYALDTINGGNNKTMTAAQFKANFPTRTWIHIAFIATTTTISLYVNGVVLIDAAAWGTAINTGAYNNLFLGKTQDSAQANVYWLNGNLKDVVIVNSALTSTEIQEHYYNGTFPSATVSSFFMEENTGSSVADGTGSNSLTGSNITWSPSVPLTRGIRASSTPAMLANCIAYYEADQGVTLDGSNNVSQWNDLSGNGAHMTQASASLRFGFSATGINGLPSVNMVDGTLNIMTAAVNFPTTTSPHTLIVFAKSTSTQPAAFSGIVALGTGGAGGNTTSIGTDNGRKLWTGGAGLWLPVFNIPTTGQSYFIVKRSDKRTDITNIDGVNQTPYQQPQNYNISPLNTAILGQFSAGSSSGNWNVGLVAIFNRQLLDAEIESIANYINTKYSATITSGNRSAVSNRTATDRTEPTS